MSFVVGIDGPAGTGKGTVAKIISEDFGFINIDTGATYRCVTLKVIEKGISINEPDKIIEISKNIDIKLENNNGKQEVYMDNKNVTREIRTKEVSALVSQVSAIKEVRFNMVDLQRKMAENSNVIMEGRDITTYVFPNANVKIYLDASEEERAKRRYKENIEKGINSTYQEVLENIRLRDKNDRNKEIGALKIADDAIVIDTTNLTIDQVVEKVKDIIESKLKSEGIENV